MVLAAGIEPAHLPVKSRVHFQLCYASVLWSGQVESNHRPRGFNAVLNLLSYVRSNSTFQYR